MCKSMHLYRASCHVASCRVVSSRITSRYATLRFMDHLPKVSVRACCMCMVLLHEFVLVTCLCVCVQHVDLASVKAEKESEEQVNRCM